MSDQQHQGGIRLDEVALSDDPATLRPDAGVVFIGTVSSPWASREHCPTNMAAARERGRPAQLRLDAPYRPGLLGLDGASHLILLTWLDRGRRDLIVQKPRHASEARGAFALRSPVRPNPIGLHVAAITGIDHAAGLIDIDGIDVLDGTPIVDIKPYYASTDAIAAATRPGGRVEG